MKTKRKTGPKPHPTGNRVRLYSRGPFIRQDTQQMLSAWEMAYGLPVGRSIDALADFARQHPSLFRLPLTGARNKSRYDDEQSHADTLATEDFLNEGPR